MFEIGNSLREARLRRRIEFAQAEEVTKIRGKYLRALEEEQFDVLPSQTYVKGFLRTYSDYLGLDGQLYVDEYNSRFVAGDESDVGLRRSSARARERSRRAETNVVLIALAAIAVVTIVVISAWKSSGNPSTPPRQPAAVVSVKRAKVIAPTLALRGATGSSYAVIHLGGPTGPVMFQGTISRGEPETFSGTRFWLQISTPENLVIKVRGKTIHVVGGKPSVITVTPTAWSAR